MQGYVSGFNFFARAKRAELLEKHPQLKKGGHGANNEANKLLGEAWKSASLEERFPYELMAAEDKMRYLREYEMYQPPNGAAKPKSRCREPVL